MKENAGIIKIVVKKNDHPQIKSYTTYD